MFLKCRILYFLMANIPKIKFNNGEEYPVLGLGTWKSKPGQVTQAVKDAIDIGYRHIDCSPVYENEKEVGAGILAKISEGVVKREDLFVTSKLWNTRHKAENVEKGLRVTLTDLGLDYIDLYLLHWPFAFEESEELWPRDVDGKLLLTDDDYVDTWKAMESLVKRGLIKSIGLSNFNKGQVERVLSIATILPVTNQVECTPYLNQKNLMDFCKLKNITLTAHSPLGSGDKPGIKPGDLVLSDERLDAIRVKHGKSRAQIALKFQVQRGLLVIPKTVTKWRMEENTEIFDFDLAEEDMATLNGMECNRRTCVFREAAHHIHHPFTNDEY